MMARPTSETAALCDPFQKRLSVQLAGKIPRGEARAAETRVTESHVLRGLGQASPGEGMLREGPGHSGATLRKDSGF